jgi:hypothetical protein
VLPTTGRWPICGRATAGQTGVELCKRLEILQFGQFGQRSYRPCWPRRYEIRGRDDQSQDRRCCTINRCAPLHLHHERSTYRQVINFASTIPETVIVYFGLSPFVDAPTGMGCRSQSVWRLKIAYSRSGGSRSTDLDRLLTTSCQRVCHLSSAVPKDRTSEL